jgi:hypothetical protein
VGRAIDKQIKEEVAGSAQPRRGSNVETTEIANLAMEIRLFAFRDAFEHQQGNRSRCRS